MLFKSDVEVIYDSIILPLYLRFESDIDHMVNTIKIKLDDINKKYQDGTNNYNIGKILNNSFKKLKRVFFSKQKKYE